jgi:Response regulator containing a CheY-like receiver domain and a GGDEF domain
MKQTERRELLIFSACFIIFLFSLLSVYIELGQHETNLVRAYSQEQQTLSTQTADEASLILSGKGGRAALEKRVVDRVLAKNDSSSNRYYLFAADNTIVYLRNSGVTKQLRGLTVRQAYERYRMSSGNMTGLFDALSLKENQTVVFTFAADRPDQILSLSFFKANGHTYLIGICAAKDYITTQDQVVAHTLALSLFCGLLSVLFFGIAVLYILHLINSKQLLDTLRKDIRSKNMLIQFLTTESQGEYRDEQTGVYNRAFFLRLLGGSCQKKLLPVCIAVMRIQAEDANKRQDAMQAVSNALMGFVSAERIAARTDENEFSMIMLNTREARARHYMKTLSSELELRQIRADYGVAVLKSLKQNPEEVYDKAHSLMFYQSILE